MVHSHLMKREMNGMKVYPQMTFERTRALVQDILNCRHHYQNLKNTVQTGTKRGRGRPRLTAQQREERCLLQEKDSDVIAPRIL